MSNNNLVFIANTLHDSIPIYFNKANSAFQVQGIEFHYFHNAMEYKKLKAGDHIIAYRGYCTQVGTVSKVGLQNGINLQNGCTVKFFNELENRFVSYRDITVVSKDEYDKIVNLIKDSYDLVDNLNIKISQLRNDRERIYDKIRNDVSSCLGIEPTT